MIAITSCGPLSSGRTCRFLISGGHWASARPPNPAIPVRAERTRIASTEGAVSRRMMFSFPEESTLATHPFGFGSRRVRKRSGIASRVRIVCSEGRQCEMLTV